MVCVGLCVRYRAVKSPIGGRYEIGQKRCSTCDIFIEWDGIVCPCCGYRLRTKSRRRR